jgi:hypothetical protein
MRRSAGVVVLALLLVPAVPSHAGGGHAGGHGGGPGNCHPAGHPGSHGTVFLGLPWWDPLFLDSYPYGYDAELDAPDPSAAAAESPAYEPPPAFLLYCPSAKAYYPQIKTCRDPWMKIPPPPPQ